MNGPGKLKLDQQRHFLDLLVRADFSHTLFGSKPASIADGADSARLMQSLTAGRALNPNFAVVVAPKSVGGRLDGTVMVINKDSVRQTMDQNPEVFGLPPAPSAAVIENKLAELCTPQGLGQALLRDKEAVLGTLLGFGARNAQQFAEPGGWAERDDAVYSTMRNVAAVSRAMDSLVQPFGARLWNSEESTLIANDNVNTTFEINERIDALHAEALQADRNVSKERVLVQMALDALFTQPPSLSPGLTSLH